MKCNHLSQRGLLLIIIMILTAGVWALLPVRNAEAGCLNSVTVTKTTPDDSSAGTLRWAIGAVCTGGTIDFNLTYPATITLNSTNGPLVINRDLTITGPGADKLTISGNNNVEVFEIDSGTVHISGLTISDGFWDAGGGIYNDGTLTVTNCTFSDNSSPNLGGGIANNGTLTVTNCTFSDNSAHTDGGGIFNDEGGDLKVTNCTFSGNSAYSGGGIFNNGDLKVTNCTFSGNTGGEGGGIWNEGSASLRNTIVANSTSGGNCADLGDVDKIISLGHNLEYGDKTDTCNFTDSTDIVGKNPLLKTLALNAPGTTETFALQSGSPAIDAADPGNFPDTDQRGVARPQGAGPDIGAYEYVFPAPVPTMNNWGMVIFMVLAGLGTVYYLRRRKRAEG